MTIPPEDSWAPPQEHRGKSLWPRILSLLLVLLVIAVAAFPFWLSAQVTRIEVDNLATSDGPMHILVAGSDSRDDLTPEERSELGTGTAEGERSDTVFIMSLEGGKVALLSLPRDLWVTRCDGTPGRLNSATAIGGASCLVQSVRDLTGIEINHYLEMTFGGFRQLVDTVGGVELCLDEPISDRDANIDLPAGCQRLDGADSLGYVRVRKIDNDLMRIRRQQEFVQALAREIAAPSTLFNPVRLASLARESGDAVRVDSSMGLLPMARMALGLRGLGNGASVSNTVPVVDRVTSSGAAVLELVVAEAEELFAAHRSGSIFDEIVDQPDNVGLRPSDVQVTVLNGAGVSGIAAAVGDELNARGFVISSLGNAERRDTTVIQHPAGEEVSAQLVADHLPWPTRLEAVDNATGIVLVLGRDAGESQ